MLTVGSEVSVWQPLLLDWVLWMRRALRDVSFAPMSMCRKI
jgi:hypothetical protein